MPDDEAVTGWEWKGALQWLYAGVDHSYYGNGGDDCLAFIPAVQKIFETAFFFGVGVLELWYAWPRAKLPENIVPVRKDHFGQRVLLMVMCLVFGIELGFKLATQQVIWILNPCHLVTMIQIFLLTAQPSRFVAAIFRIQMHCLNGATIAVLFPIINTRLMPFETEVYFLQHLLILVVPFFLLRSGGVFVVEAYSNFTWVLLTLGLLFVYHWIPLQLLAMVSHVNLNNMMCPAVSDPFHGRWYRVCASTHQTVLIFVHGKIYAYLSSLLLRRDVTEHSLESRDAIKSRDTNHDSSPHTNGFIKSE